MAPETFQRILITGSSGFIGSWVTNTLVKRGHRIRGLYRRKSIPTPLEEIRKEGVEIERRDLTVREEVRLALQNIDAVIHCAALARDWGYEKDYYAQNFEVSKTLVDEARRTGCRAFQRPGSESP
jgi:nucleoside-diphosphate-sugar epimerase